MCTRCSSQLADSDNDCPHPGMAAVRRVWILTVALESFYLATLVKSVVSGTKVIGSTMATVPMDNAIKPNALRFILSNNNKYVVFAHISKLVIYPTQPRWDPNLS